MDAPLALYRRYRPETFTEVLGQEHVTGPLRRALADNRVHHAYLFSGPRGCGKTTSARILARTLNCEQFPVAEPCGECQSCRDLARGGPGSLDVIEIDAASHGGVDDTRDLRERATFAPMTSRFKVYVIDEAHMVSPQGFNALLKVVEEPPPHVKFIFATTEPDKVIGTIRSRTHHYPFRLLPPRLLADYLAQICEREAVAIEPQALPLVVRAGAGSARDSLSVLDQLIGGAGPDGVTYDLATGLLGYTPETLLDSVVDAFAAGDGGGVFTLVDQVVEGGREPRRFVEDLLQRLRDLLVLSHLPSAGEGLLDVPVDQAERLAGQAARFGAADLVRSAEVVAATLADLRGPTAPRLLLEIMCARVLLPAADDSAGGVQARLDRIERRMAVGTTPAPPVPADAPVPALVEPPPVPQPVEPPTEPPTEPPPVPQPVEPPPVEPPAATASAAVGNELHQVRTLWNDVLDDLRSSRYVWSLVGQNAQVVAAEPGIVTLGFSTVGLLQQFQGREQPVAASLSRVLLGDWQVRAIVDPAARQAQPHRAEPTAAVPPVSAPDSARARSAQPAVAQRPAGSGAADEPGGGAAPDDADLDSDASGSTRELLTRELGATVIEEIPHGR
ncbi:MAG: DNA polymerase III subunit gamma and tau [Nocardioidaceae bacterium]|nr:DNA polymerase III subunit gamma and tau [Nocardioidaceae bacterium]